MGGSELSPSVRFLKALAEGDFEGTHVLQRETANRVMTEKRIELLHEIVADPPESMRALARRVDRDISRVSGDLDELYKANIIDYEQEGRSKRPILAKRNVLVEPIVFDGEVMDGADSTE